MNVNEDFYSKPSVLSTFPIYTRNQKGGMTIFTMPLDVLTKLPTLARITAKIIEELDTEIKGKKHNMNF